MYYLGRLEAILGEIQIDFFSTKMWILYTLIGFAVYTHFRGKESLPFKRQILDHSTFFAPYNLLMDAFSKHPCNPILERSDFPHLDPLKEHYKTIKLEASSLYQSGDIRSAEKHNDIAFNSFFRTGWTRFHIKWYDKLMPSAIEKCPKTSALIASIPEINSAMFAVLPEKGRLGKHRDPFGGSLRYHLGLDTPNSDDCYILIDDQMYSWRDGEDIVFDETFVHSAMNNTTKPRIILFCDVTRPLKTEFMRNVNQFVINHVIKIAKAQNTASEKVGALNKVAGGIFKLKTFFESVKKFNRKLYYGLKYTLLFALVWWLFLSS